jgi:predicted Zn-dependent protease
MKDQVYVYNGSRKPIEGIIVDALVDISRYRSVEVIPVNGAFNFINQLAKKHYNKEKRQVHGVNLLNELHLTSVMRKTENGGRVIVIDYDQYDDATDWCFGGFNKSPIGLGYILISTARFEDEILAREVFSHELGHMFGAPRKNRKNTEENLGEHCVNDYCVMQQKDTIAEALKFGHERVDAGAEMYCPDCATDIKNHKYKVRE